MKKILAIAIPVIAIIIICYQIFNNPNVDNENQAKEINGEKAGFFQLPEGLSMETTYGKSSPNNDSTSIKILLDNYSMINVSQEVKPIGKLNIPNGKTLDFTEGGNLLRVDTIKFAKDGSTKVINPDGNQIFSKNVVILNKPDIPYATADWFGVPKDGKKDGSVEFVKAFELSDNVKVTPGNYMLAKPIKFPLGGRLIGINQHDCNFTVNKNIAAIELNYPMFHIEGISLRTNKSDYKGALMRINIRWTSPSPSNENRFPIVLRDLVIQGVPTNKGTGLSIEINGKEKGRGVVQYFGLIENVHILNFDTACIQRGNVHNGEKTNGWRYSNVVFDQYNMGLVLDTLCNGNLISNCYFQPAKTSKNSIYINTNFNKITNCFIVDYSRHNKKDRPVFYLTSNSSNNMLNFSQRVYKGYSTDLGNNNYFLAEGAWTGQNGYGYQMAKTGVVTFTNSSSQSLKIEKDSKSACVVQLGNTEGKYQLGVDNMGHYIYDVTESEKVIEYENSAQGLDILFNRDVEITKGKNLTIQAPIVPKSSRDKGTPGTISWDQEYIYVCVATNKWKRMEISSW